MVHYGAVPCDRPVTPEVPMAAFLRTDFWEVLQKTLKNDEEL